MSDGSRWKVVIKCFGTYTIVFSMPGKLLVELVQPYLK